MAVAPTSTLTRRVSRSNKPYALLALAYGVALAASWQADTLQLMMPGSLAEGFKGGFNPQFIPSLEGVAALFGRSFAAASFLLHVAFINLFAARTIYNHGVVSRLPTSHSVLLAAVAGPLGLLSHLLTKAWFAVLSKITGRDMRPRPRAIKAAGGSGVIVILPYEEQ
ncbi:hypothetical protein MNEG_5162 [Monoraphidium neglectum]|uniref:Uncharacterized protein n=1 Tax=Monoraphidium neglectum TaxID=145388 RepID=A0A0D2JVH8_9CHLO|nr:hypothetical protein MNEG_5162 [Monoraphidium neglectum]KIZ02793.1 hypothetical protein MNEG_5162 [Monoraphidium neglectum]|eukprot:XP_013901812.1 hypothetical protein MNEG_5162 [Monoraphidium neglectum]